MQKIFSIKKYIYILIKLKIGFIFCKEKILISVDLELKYNLDMLLTEFMKFILLYFI